MARGAVHVPLVGNCRIISLPLCMCRKCRSFIPRFSYTRALAVHWPRWLSTCHHSRKPGMFVEPLEPVVSAGARCPAAGRSPARMSPSMGPTGWRDEAATSQSGCCEHRCKEARMPARERVPACAGLALRYTLCGLDAGLRPVLAGACRLRMPSSTSSALDRRLQPSAVGGRGRARERGELERGREAGGRQWRRQRQHGRQRRRSPRVRSRPTTRTCKVPPDRV